MENPLAHLAIRLINDPPPHALDAIYGVAQTATALSESSVFGGLERLWSVRTPHPGIFICGESGGVAYPGFDAWKQGLLALRSDWRIEPVMGGKKGETPKDFNTATELDAFVRTMKDRNYTTVAIVAPTLHLPRAYVTAVTSVLVHCPQLNIFGVCGIPLSWSETVLHSQGKESMTRDAFIDDEITKIGLYANLISVETVLDYMRERDERLSI